MGVGVGGWREGKFGIGNYNRKIVRNGKIIFDASAAASEFPLRAL